MRIFTLFICALCAGAAYAQEPLEGTPIDGVTLTGVELEEYNASVAARATALRNTKAFIENVVVWIDQTAPAVVTDTSEQARIEVMRADFISLGKRVMTALSEQEIKGPDIRDRTLSRTLESRADEVLRIERELEVLQGDEEPDENTLARIADAETRQAAAEAERVASETALNDFRALQEARER
jgi:very-short-patch-repair endonuclease